MAGGAPKHPYHLVDPSPWPAFGAFAGFVLAAGALLAMHPDLLGAGPKAALQAMGWWKLAPGLVLVAITMWYWWKDVIVESRIYHTGVVQIGLRYGMILFIVSEIFFFVAWFWAFFDAALFPGAANMPGRTEVTGGIWPPKGVTIFNPFDLPLMNTLILLLSGTTVTWAHHAILEGDQKSAVRGLALTVGLGAIFTCVQAYEYAHAAFGFREGIYSSTFYMATGFHGAHVLIGTIFLLVCLFRAQKGHFTPKQHFGFEAAAWYWHFVDVVWLFLFFCIYWWGAGHAPMAAH
jgi:cytochrome c oxidase subunit 3